MKDIEIKDLNFSYGDHKVLKNLNLSIDKGEIIIIYGGNGCGKSTLLKVLLGELKEDSGVLKIKNEKNTQELDCVGYVPQMQVANQVGFPITSTEMTVLGLYREFGFLKIPRKKHIEKARKMLNVLGLEKHLDRPFNKLSGGLKQRVMIARSLVSDPQILILDEPTAGVDLESKRQFLELIKKINKEKELTTIIVTHETEFIESVLNVDAKYEMKEGALHVTI